MVKLVKALSSLTVEAEMDTPAEIVLDLIQYRKWRNGRLTELAKNTLEKGDVDWNATDFKDEEAYKKWVRKNKK